MAGLFYAQQFAVTKLSVSGGIDDSQTTGIVLQSVTGIDTAKPGVICINWSDPLDTDLAEYISYTSIDGSNELQGVVRGAEGSTAKNHDNLVDVAWVLTESHINKLNDMFTTGGEGFTQIATPSNPASGFNKLYFKNDDKLYRLNSVGTEVGFDNSFKTILTPLTAIFGAANYPQLVKNVGTNKVDFTLDYDASSIEYAHWDICLPTGLVINSATLYIFYRMASATSGAVLWEVYTGSAGDNETWDSATQTDTFSADTVADNAAKVNVCSKALTPSGWGAGESFYLCIGRKASDGSDTATGDAKLTSAILVIT